MKKILWLHSHFLYWMGGTKLVFQIMSHLNKEIKITAAVEDFSEIAEENYKKAGIELIKTTGISSTSPLYWLNLEKYIKLNIEILQKYVDDETIVISSMFPMNVVGNALTKNHFQYLFEPFAFFHEDYLINNLPFAKRLFTKFTAYRYKSLDIEATKNARGLFTLNHHTSNAIERIYGRSAVPTYTGIDTDFFKHYDSPDLEEKYKNKKVIIHPTDFTPIKRTDLILRAVSIAKEKHPDILLLITSTIDDKHGIEEMYKQADELGIRDNIEYLGFVEYKDLPRYYSFSRIMLQGGINSKTGTTSFSLPSKEALACETPVIRNNLTNEDVENNVSGLLIDPDNTKDYAQGIIYLLDNPEIAREMGQKGREKVLNTFTWDKVTKTILENIN